MTDCSVALEFIICCYLLYAMDNLCQSATMKAKILLLLHISSLLYYVDAFQNNNNNIISSATRSDCRKIQQVASLANDKLYAHDDDDAPNSITSSTELYTQHADDAPISIYKLQRERRTFLQNILFSTALISVSSNNNAYAAEESNNLPKITNKIYMDVRISRKDGSFYVKDDVDPTDEPFYGRLVFGLFGDAAPNHVNEFLSYVEVPFDDPLPSYSKSKFQTLDSSTGLLIGMIPGLDISTLGGGSALEYGGKVLPAKLWLEDNKDATQQLSHNAKGLLTHRNLDVTPNFGITTRSTSTLDPSHTIFGMILEDRTNFMDRIVDLPVLTDTGRVSKTTNEPSGGDVGSLASSVFTAQRAVFRDAAKTFGDTRLDKVYDGKLLRRVEVTKVGIL